MANRFSIDTGRKQSLAPAILSLVGQQLAGKRQEKLSTTEQASRERISTGQVALGREQIAESALARQQKGVQIKAQLKQNKAEAVLREKEYKLAMDTLGAAKTSMAPEHTAAFNARIKSRMDRIGGTSYAKTSEAYTNQVDNLSKSGVARIDIYEYTKKNQIRLFQDPIEFAEKELQKAYSVNNQDDIGKWTEELKLLNSPSASAGMFPESVQYQKSVIAQKAHDIALKKASGTVVPPGTVVPSGKEIRAQEEFEIKKRNTITDFKNAILQPGEGETAEGNINVFGPRFNRENKNNEVVFMNTTGRNATEVVTVPPEAQKAGWTPAKIQKAADDSNMSVEEVLIELGLK